MRQLHRALIPIVALAISSPLSAQVYSGGLPNGEAGFNIDNDFRAADDFQLSGTTTFDAIRFWGLLPMGPAYNPTIFWEIFLDSGSGLPGVSVASGSALAPSALRTGIGFGFDSWQFDFSTGTQALGAGIYWLALHDGLMGDITDSSLIWEKTSGGHRTDHAVEFLGEWTGGWEGNLAFELHQSAAVVPEPATLLLLGSGLIAVGAALRRRRQNEAG